MTNIPKKPTSITTNNNRATAFINFLFIVTPHTNYKIIV